MFKVEFKKGRGDASQEQTDEHSFSVLEPFSDGFRNYHKNNFNIICHFNNSEKEAENLKDQLNTERENSCEIIQYDLNDIEGINNFCNEVKDIFGRLDVLVNNASTFYSDDLEINEGSNWNDLINSNVKAPYYLVSNFKDELKKNYGSIVNITDAMVIRGMEKFPIYSIAKGGLETITRSLARKLAPEIRVNGVAPGAILWPEQNPDPDEQILMSIPLGRIGSAEDISSAVFHLVENKYITGQIIRVDGGRSLN